MSTRLFDRDPILGITRLFHYDDAKDDGSFSIEERTDVEPLLDLNRIDRNASDRHRIGGEGHGVKVASIPLVLFAELAQKGITRDQKAMRRWLNDRENRMFRTHEMKV